MQRRLWQHWKKQVTLFNAMKYAAVLFLFLLSAIVVACGGNGTTASSQANLDGPPVTVTINLNRNRTPPPIKEYYCFAWATNTSPSLASQQVGVYAKFTHNVNGNPEGVAGATAIATVTWPDGSVQSITAITSGDGLAVFPIPIVNKSPTYANRLTLVTVNFSKPGTPGCVVDVTRAAFFTLVITSPTATPNNNGDNGNNDNNGNRNNNGGGGNNGHRRG
ncbi:MAG: hypothetical protein IMW89_16575 [Ktedonobacteraceae bacterium]|nr:hypothetical protein [Ktedonobacteraceae bacterium]